MYNKNSNRSRSSFNKDKNYSKQMVEKYKNLIRDRRTVEDITTIERFAQLVEHYQRCYNASSNGSNSEFGKNVDQKNGDQRSSYSKQERDKFSNRNNKGSEAEVQEIEITTSTSFDVSEQDGEEKKASTKRSSKSGTKVLAKKETKKDTMAVKKKKADFSEDGEEVPKPKTRKAVARKKITSPAEKGFLDSSVVQE